MVSILKYQSLNSEFSRKTSEALTRDIFASSFAFYTCCCTNLVQQLLNFQGQFCCKKDYQVLSQVQTDATTPKIVGQQIWEQLRPCVGSGVQRRMQQLPTMLAYHACWSITRSYCVAVSKETMSKARLCPQQCWKSFKNGPNIIVLLCGDHGAKEMLAQKFDQFQTLRNNTQQHSTTCNRGCKRMQHVHVQQCWELLTNNVASGIYFLKTIAA